MSVNTGNIFVTESSNSRCQVFSPDGKYLFGFGAKGSSNGELQNPWGVLVDPQEMIYIAEGSNHRGKYIFCLLAWIYFI